jgi:N-acetylmuramoyl-L-alanine amidase
LIRNPERLSRSERSRLPLVIALAGLLFQCLSLAIACDARATQLLGFRTGPHGDTLRVVLDLDAKAPVEIRPGAGGVAIRISISGIETKTKLVALENPHRRIRAITPRLSKRLLEIEIDARVPVRPIASWIPPSGGKGWRYVIDLVPIDAGGAKTAAPVKSTPAAPAKPRDGDAGAGVAAAPPVDAVPAAPIEPEPPPRRAGKWRILIDPGHGGPDPGARRGQLAEKDIVFDVARRIARILNNSSICEARLSRNDDRRIGLRDRHAIAESYEADAFVSVHVNAAPKQQAMGVEVFFLSLRGASDEASRELARLENEADPDYVCNEDSLLTGIPFSFDLRQSDTLLRSSRLAEVVLSSFEESRLAASRGVKQAGFAVLKSFQVPSILVEVGFISNPVESKRLAQADHREKVAACMAGGIVSYFDRYARAHVGAVNAGE